MCGQWWVDQRGGAPVRVEGMIRHRGAPAVVIAAPGDAGRECALLVIDAGVFERWFVPLENAGG